MRKAILEKSQPEKLNKKNKKSVFICLLFLLES